jgi:hypothetical protein
MYPTGGFPAATGSAEDCEQRFIKKRKKGNLSCTMFALAKLAWLFFGANREGVQR